MKHLFVIGCLLITTAAHSQNVSFDAVKISEALTSATWEQIEQIIPALMLKLEKDMMSSGATDQASKVYAEELRRTFTRDNLTRIWAQMVSSRLTVEEQQEVLGFLQSSSGQKFLALSQESKLNVKYTLPLLKQSCSSANSRLDSSDRLSLQKVCGRYL